LIRVTLPLACLLLPGLLLSHTCTVLAQGYLDRAVALRYVENVCLNKAFRLPALLALQLAQGITPQKRCECMATLVVSSATDDQLRFMLSNGVDVALSRAGPVCVAVQN